jgi:pimeloyl-ACP methyl ester carboxylesterase
MVITLNNLQLNYTDSGTGQTILILPGWGSSSTAWQTVVADLSQTYRVLVLDLPGFGQSQAPREVWGVEEYTNIVKGFLQKLGLDEYILLGHSFGGQIALNLASGNERLPSRLILCAPAALRHPLTVKQKFFHVLAKIGKAIFSLPGLRVLGAPLRKVLYRAAGSQDYAQAQGMMRAVMAKVLRQDLTVKLPSVKMPTLLVWGSEDKSVPVSDGEKMRMAMPQAQLRVIAGVDHGFPYKAWEQFAPMLKEFLL